MNKFLTKIWDNKELRWEIGIIIVSACCSALCAVLTQDMVLTAIYIAITAVIDIISEIESEAESKVGSETEKLIDWKTIIDRIFRIDKKIKYLVCVGFAVLPTLSGIIVFNEIAFSGMKDILPTLLVNIFPNVCGALIVCSLITYISKLNETEFVSALIQSKKSLFNIVIRLIFFVCYLNAVNYKADDGWMYANYVNSAYLFFIISCGAITAMSFFFRLVDARPFPYTVIQVFPGWTLFFSGAFLFSCGAAPLLAKVGKHEPFLLLINTFTVVVVFGGLLWFLSCKADKSNREYPIVQFFLFLAFAIANCIGNFLLWNKKGDIISQLVSGLLILGGAIFLLLFTFYWKRKNLKKLETEENRMGEVYNQVDK